MSQPQDKTAVDVEKAHAKAFFKKHASSQPSKPDGSSFGSSSSPTQAELNRIAQKNQVRMNF
ncbi:hypothetical protein F4814DRAFT_450649 [Daldinia grandis]|nr:hypothetical protein F4814DRAFT_450649 [Daldinia grandis]